MQMRWEEIEAGWTAMTRRVRADWPGAGADNAPVVAFLATARTAAVTDAKTNTPPPDRPMP